MLDETDYAARSTALNAAMSLNRDRIAGCYDPVEAVLKDAARIEQYLRGEIAFGSNTITVSNSVGVGKYALDIEAGLLHSAPGRPAKGGGHA